MNLSRAAYSRDLKIAAMRALDAGSGIGEIARKYQLSPMALIERRPAHGLVHHSDRGVQYASGDYTEGLKQHRAIISTQ